jgi:hypothetical protein
MIAPTMAEAASKGIAQSAAEASGASAFCAGVNRTVTSGRTEILVGLRGLVLLEGLGEGGGASRIVREQLLQQLGVVGPGGDRESSEACHGYTSSLAGQRITGTEP